MRLRGSYVLAAAATSVVVLLGSAGPAAAANLHCGEQITSSVTLIGNLDCSSSGAPALWIGADNVTLNLNGFKVTGDSGANVIDNFANGTGGTTADTPANGTTIKNGTLVVNGPNDGVDNGFGGSKLTLDVVNIVSDGTAVHGVFSQDGSNTTVLDGSIRGVTSGVTIWDETGDLVKNVTIAPYLGQGCAGVWEVSGTTNMVVGNAFSQFDPVNQAQTCSGLFTVASAGTQFTGNTVTGIYAGVLAAEDAGLVVTSNVMDGNEIGVEVGASSGDLIAGNYVKNSAEFGVLDSGSFNNTYNGNILTSNGSAGNLPSYYIDSEGSGPVTMVDNYARLSYAAGFQIVGAYSESVSGPPYSSFVGNNAIGNGTGGGAGFLSYYNVGSTWSQNTAYANASDGFVFDQPWRQIITGNSAKLNGDDGFLFTEADENNQPLAVTDNSATYNGGYGFSGWEDEGEAPPPYPVSGSGNTGGGTNGLGDCYLVAGCS